MRTFPILMAALAITSCDGKRDAVTESEKINPEQLLECCGMYFSDEKVVDVFRAFKPQKLKEITTKSYGILHNDIKNPRYTEIKTHYISHEPPLEIVTSEKRDAEDPFNHSEYVNLIRIGYPLDGELAPYSAMRARIETSPSQQAEIVSKQADMARLAEPLFPYGIQVDMSPDEVNELCSRPYAPGMVAIDKSGGGFIKFYDGYGSPLPVTVWFLGGRVCGVDIHTWGKKEAQQAAPSNR